MHIESRESISGTAVLGHFEVYLVHGCIFGPERKDPRTSGTNAMVRGFQIFSWSGIFQKFFRRSWTEKLVFEIRLPWTDGTIKMCGPSIPGRS